MQATQSMDTLAMTTHQTTLLTIMRIQLMEQVQLYSLILTQETKALAWRAHTSMHIRLLGKVLSRTSVINKCNTPI